MALHPGTSLRGGGAIVARHALLHAALGFLALEPRAPELQLLHRCFDTWRGVGEVAWGWSARAIGCTLTNIEVGTWRATFLRDAMAAAEGFAAAPTPWAAVQVAARQALA